VLTFSGAIRSVNVELKANVTDLSSVSIIRVDAVNDNKYL
jgi:hypothetical protein